MGVPTDGNSTPLVGTATPVISLTKNPEKTPFPIKPKPSKPDKSTRGKAFRQVVVSFVANLGTINTGMAFGFPATALPQLQSETSYIQVTESQASWIASLSAAGTPFGCLLSGYLMDTIGRRLTLIITEIPLIIGWLLIACAQNVPMLYVGRLLIGLGSGMVGAPARVYTCEVTQPHLRGMLGALASVGVSTGVLIQYVIGSATSWTVLAGVSSIIPMVSLIGMILIPESPNYLLTQDKPERAEKCLLKLRGSTCDVDGELQKMIAFKEKNHVEHLKSPKEIIKAIMSPSAMKPFIILALYFLIYQWCGINTITFYAVQIFEFSGTSMDKYWATMSLGVLRLISTVAGCIMCRRFGRRPLTFVSAVGCGSTMIILSVYLYFVKYWKDNSMPFLFTWIPVAAIYVFMIACTLGYLIIPWVMIGEVYPTQVRGIVGGMTTMAAHLSVFSVVKTFPFLRHALYDYGVFGLYGALSIAGIAFFYMFLPETKGRTLQEIEDYFSGRTKTLKKESIASQGA
ncbi:facilitated trehalose transporter Tret1-2 homolog isoform X1 [Hyposmocoma kahamanoa]|uniref:facilitated trehalose transporter Tret1-2 homolog isoform X1 n=1 Tax=Hyposmocoma kahamanoa TaxID=1477025 RepID=UPI000E6D84E8|nr:facilitated trehalose transporter Tret1-2 homolog isoform X1 [Hyposmocoma kahamanoa]